jgi:hypothetical protein
MRRLDDVIPVRGACGVPRPLTLHHAAFPARRAAAERELSVSVCLPARDEAAAIGAILHSLMPLLEQDVVDGVVVLDDSSDALP